MADISKLPTAPKSPTPLWVISAFISLTIVTTGYAVTQATGGVQVALATFAVLFPTLIALAFFYVLWRKNYVFWPPSEFKDVDIDIYMKATQQSAMEKNRIYQILKEAVASAVEVFVNELGVKPQDAEKAAKRLAEAAIAKVDRMVVYVDTSSLSGSSANVIAAPYHPDTIMASFLDAIWFPIADVVRPYTYGQSWVVRDKATKKVFDAGRPWAERNGLQEDNRALKELGITPESQLEVVSPQVTT